MKPIDIIGSVVRTRRRQRREKGQVLVVFALMLVALLASAGLVIDLGGSWAQVRSEQKVADVAALAGATAEANGATRAQIIQTAMDSAIANGFDATEVQVNIPPTAGAYAPGGSASGPLSSNDCSSAAQYPCWVEVKITRPHENSFSRVLGFNSFDSAARGVAVGGVANAVQVGISPIMFNYKALQEHGTTPFVYCDPHRANARRTDPGRSWATSSRGRRSA